MEIVLLALYMTPTIVAVLRKHPSVGSIAVLNIFLGWSIVGWIVALAMAAGSTQPRGPIVIGKTQPSIVIENILGDHNSISRRESVSANGHSAPAVTQATRACTQGHAVPVGTKFCPQCGVLVAKTCTNGHTIDDAMKFCGECGSAAGALPTGTV